MAGETSESPSRPQGEKPLPVPGEGVSPLDTSTFEDRIAQLIAELEDAKSRTLRVMADYQNYQRRAIQNEQVARRQGIGDVVMAIVPVLDHFDLALGQDVGKATAAQIVAGVRVIREELLKALGQAGVSIISPAKGEEFVPGRHEAIMQQAEPGVAPGHIVATYQVGVIQDANGQERVLRPAKVAVAP